MKTSLNTVFQMALVCWGLFALTPSAGAQQSLTYRYTGQVTSVHDPFNWLNDTYAVGGEVSGLLTYFDSGYSKGFIFDYPASRIYQNNVNVSSPNHPDFSLVSGTREMRQEGDRFSLTVTDNGPDPVNGVVGDSITVAPQVINIPTFLKDPANTPGFEDYYAFPFAFLRLQDPTGTALTTSDLPYPLPPLSGFSTAFGRIGLSDGNGTYEEAAVMDFRLTSLQLVPEPGTAAIMIGAALLSLTSRRRRWARQDDWCEGYGQG